VRKILIIEDEQDIVDIQPAMLLVDTRPIAIRKNKLVI